MFGQNDNIFARSDWLRHVTYVRDFLTSRRPQKSGRQEPEIHFWLSLENRIIKWRRRLLISTCLELRCISEVSAVDLFDLFDPLHGISRVIFQVINTFWLKKKRKYKVFYRLQIATSPVKPPYNDLPAYNVIFNGWSSAYTSIPFDSMISFSAEIKLSLFITYHCHKPHKTTTSLI